MSLFSVFHSLRAYLGDTPVTPPATPAVNIDGTPMVNEYMDVHGHPYGVTESMFDLHTVQDSWSSASHDMGGGDFGDHFGGGCASGDW